MVRKLLLITNIPLTQNRSMDLVMHKFWLQVAELEVQNYAPDFLESGNVVIDNQHQVVLPQLVEVGQQVAKHHLGELQHHRGDPENAVVTEGNVSFSKHESLKE